MVCPACVSAVILAQLPAISAAAAVSAAGVKLAFDKRMPVKGGGKPHQKVLKVRAVSGTSLIDDRWKHVVTVCYAWQYLIILLMAMCFRSFAVHLNF